MAVPDTRMRWTSSVLFTYRYAKPTKEPSNAIHTVARNAVRWQSKTGKNSMRIRSDRNALPSLPFLSGLRDSQDPLTQPDKSLERKKKKRKEKTCWS